MKKITIIILGILVSGIAYAQQSTQNDIHARIGMYIKLNPQVLNVQVTSAEAQSIVTVITEAFENYMVVPEVSLNQVPGSERSEIIAFQGRLNDLLKNPPTWEQIVQQQITLNSTPPTPPVYAGDAKAQEFYNAKKAGKTRASANTTPVHIESQIVIDPPIPVEQKKSE